MSCSIIKRSLVLCCLAAALSLFAASAMAAPKIKLGSVGWTGVTIKTELASAVLQSLGYETESSVLSVPIVYSAMSTGGVDVFLGNWMPSMASIANKFFDKGTVVKYVANMPGAKYTLATPTFCAEKGLKDFSDIAKFHDELEGKIYGIEAGNDGNLIIRDMIKKDMFGLGSFELVPSSEMAMLAEVQSFAKRGKCIVFLGWAPHSMNERVDMTYLTGSDDSTFGGNDGTATVWTNVRKGFAEDHPNAGKLFKNMTFSIDMMNQIMTSVYKDKSLKLKDAGLGWIKQHPEVYTAWLDGVTTLDGKPGKAAFAAWLDKNVQ